MTTLPDSPTPHTLDTLIPTESLNPGTVDIDLLSTQDVLTRINAEDQQVAQVVQQAIPQITPVVDRIVQAFQCGGRLFYFGAGTSGRLGVLDASECPPTYGVSPDLVQGIIAGGDVALRSAVEGAEDDEQLGKKDFKRLDIQPVDVVIGISASGHAPYVVAAMQAARENGCYTACITGVSSSRLAHAVEQPIVVNVGAEVIAGSTRMKAGTAQKLVLNMLTTGAMIQTGKTYENLMVDLRPTNSKLRQRATRIVTTLGQVNPDKANQLLSETGFEVKTAVLMARYPLSVESAREQLLKASGKLRLALKLLAG